MATRSILGQASTNSCACLLPGILIERSELTTRKLQRAKKAIPAFKSEAEEREFWPKADSTEYVDWTTATPMRFPNLRPSSTAISVRLPNTLLTELKLLANEH